MIYYYLLTDICNHFWQRNQRLMSADQDAWWETFTRLNRIIRKAAQVLFITKRFDRDQRHNYFMSGESPRQMHWNLIWKSPGFVLFRANLTHFGAKPTIPVHTSLTFERLVALESPNQKWENQSDLTSEQITAHFLPMLVLHHKV